MARFRFRAAAALDIRRKQEDAARLIAAQAELVLAAARERTEAAHGSMLDGGHQLLDDLRGGSEAWRVRWHRDWIERQRLEVEQRARERDERAAQAATAAVAVREALKRRRVLERLRDRALRRHRKAAHDSHVKEMNELATLRYVAQITEGDFNAD
jgi:hypothetical protein